MSKETANDQHGGRIPNQIVGADIQKALQLIDVVIQNRHQSAGAAIFKVGQVQILHVLIGLHTQFVLNRLRQIAPVHVLDKIERQFQHPDDQRQHGERDKLRFHIDDAKGSEERPLTPDDHVDSRADQHRRHHVEDFVQHREQSLRRDAADVDRRGYRRGRRRERSFLATLWHRSSIWKRSSRSPCWTLVIWVLKSAFDFIQHVYWLCITDD